MDGAGKIDTKAIMARVSANRDRLDACPRHLFEPLPLEAIRLGAKVECSRCGGELRLTDVNQYIRGYEAHGGNGNDILPGWKDEPGNEQPIRRSFFNGSAD